MIALLRWTLWQRRWSLFWWSLALFAFIFINLIFYPTFKDQAAELQKSFESLPKAAVQLLGGSTDFFSPIGFMQSQIYFLMLPLLLGILAISLGASLVGREEQNKTIENLLARPISRSRFLALRALAGTIIVVIVSIVGTLSILGISKLVGLEIGSSRILFTSVVCLLLALSFGAISFVIAATGRARIAAVGIATTAALGGYIISSLAGTVSWLDDPSKIFPFDYYQSEAVLRGTYNWANALFFVIFIIVCGFISWLSFRKRDLG